MDFFESAVYCGVRPDEFWKSTPFEIEAIIKMFNKRTQIEQQNDMVCAYLTAYWHRVKKMPSLNEVLKDTTVKSKKQTAEDMLEEIKRINTALGGTVY